MSHFQVHPNTVLRIATVTATLSTAFLTLGNLGAMQFGIMPLIAAPKGAFGTQKKSSDADVALAQAKESLTDSQRADLFVFFYDRAKDAMVPNMLASGLAFATAAYFLPKKFGTPGVRGLLTRERAVAIVGLVASLTALPYTLQVLMPINKQLIAISKGDKTKEPYVPKLANRWVSLHAIRVGFFATALAAAVVLRELI